MKKYFYSDGKEKNGPFSFDELKKEKINPEILIWFEGLSDWTPIKDIKELEEILHLTPPPIPKTNESDKTIVNKKTYNKAYKLTGFNVFQVNKSLRLEWQHKIWKKCQYGILTFCLFNFAFEIIFAEGKTNFIWPVIVNYVISAWYLGRKIAKGRMYQKPYWTGLLVAFIIFMVRVVIGTLLIVSNNYIQN